MYIPVYTRSQLFIPSLCHVVPSQTFKTPYNRTPPIIKFAQSIFYIRIVFPYFMNYLNLINNSFDL